ncbi:unnamed protein product [Tuwongella immobilis]|uniref:Uncharacterized protein n=1 Tax=Tuwongella immobilis TaxID=692036 RepID=A0A6C2YW57_9BACT|nr:unnamed protein product [Tuwongella immobilis]VTS07754.1 unnamed protein product [Tuwongella immobilis]
MSLLQKGLPPGQTWIETPVLGFCGRDEPLKTVAGRSKSWPLRAAFKIVIL